MTGLSVYVSDIAESRVVALLPLSEWKIGRYARKWNYFELIRRLIKRNRNKRNAGKLVRQGLWLCSCLSIKALRVDKGLINYIKMIRLSTIQFNFVILVIQLLRRGRRPLYRDSYITNSSRKTSVPWMVVRFMECPSIET